MLYPSQSRPCPMCYEPRRTDAAPTSIKEQSMNLIILLIVGGLIGWVASMIMRTDAQQGVFLNIVVGIVGALLAGFLITPLIGGASIMDGALNIQSILISLVGAVILLAIVNMFRGADGEAARRSCRLPQDDQDHKTRRVS